MKVLTFTSLFPNGVKPNFGVFIKNRMLAFRQRGHDIKVVAPVPYFPRWKWLQINPKWSDYARIKKEEVIDNLAISHPRFFNFPKIGMSTYGASMCLSSISTIRKIKKVFDFDIIDAHYIYPDGLAGVLLGKIFNKPVVVSARGSDISLYAHLPIIRNLIRYTLKKADSIISVSGDLSTEMIKLGIPENKVNIIPNGIDTKHFYQTNQKEARQKLNIPEDQTVIISIGELIPRKNFKILIDALKFLKKNEHLYIIGKGRSKEELGNYIEKHKLQDRAHLVGAVPHTELISWYNAADLFCLASLREGSPNVVYEALGCGLPVVGTDLVGIKTALSGGNKGIYVEKWDGENFSKAITEVLTSPIYNRNWIAQEAKKRPWDVVAQEVEKVFQLVLEKNIK